MVVVPTSVWTPMMVTAACVILDIILFPSKTLTVEVSDIQERDPIKIWGSEDPSHFPLLVSYDDPIKFEPK